jgi:membrane protein YqaA with SNARE-associated domain
VTVLAVGLAVAVGVASALVPVLNAEAWAVVAATGPLDTLLVVVPALAVGQTVGKLVLFETGRRGRAWHPWRGRPVSARAARWGERVTAWLTSPRTGPPVVLAAASLGVPPLAVVSVAAGAAGQGRWVFGALCLLGRLVRFSVLVVPVAAAQS